ncbi:MAG TPA: PilZ domain-containing protein [Sedimentisphaerales bacterium]|nr:PilZ domain-containing protein [Sedimentisphaerales bacterium]
MDRMSEKRKYRRLELKLELFCRRLGSPAEESYAGRTVNVSPGGLYFETEHCGFEAGGLVEVQLCIPPTAGLLQLGGRLSGIGKVLRAGSTGGGDASSTGAYGVAVEFSQGPRFRI